MKLYQCLLEQNDCYKRGVKITPTKIVVHSTGANNNTVKRYVQPYVGQTSGMEEYLPQRKHFLAQRCYLFLVQIITEMIGIEAVCKFVFMHFWVKFPMVHWQ